MARQGLKVQTFHYVERIHNFDLDDFDSIILDIQLPGMWGSEYGYTLRQIGYKDPIIAISGNLENWDKDDLTDPGFTCASGLVFFLFLKRLIRFKMNKKALQAMRNAEASVMY